MPLVLTLRQSPSIPIEADAARVEIVREQTLDQVRATLIQHGNRRESLGEFFDVTECALKFVGTMIADFAKDME